MPRFALSVSALLFLAVAMPQAARAFSTESGSNVVKGPSSNFADPDEQQPAFVAGGENGSVYSPSSSPSVTVDQTQRRENNLGLTQGFDQAYSRK